MIYGTMNLAKCEEPLKFLDQAFNMGINTFDLASVYGSKVELLLENGLKVGQENQILITIIITITMKHVMKSIMVNLHYEMVVLLNEMIYF